MVLAILDDDIDLVDEAELQIEEAFAGVELEKYYTVNKFQSGFRGADVLVVDLSLPEKTGLEIAAELNAKGLLPRHTFLLTGYSRAMKESDTQMAKSLGISILSKDSDWVKELQEQLEG